MKRPAEDDHANTVDVGDLVDTPMREVEEEIAPTKTELETSVSSFLRDCFAAREEDVDAEHGAH